MLILAVIFLGWSVTLAVATGLNTSLHTVIYNAAPGLLNNIQNGIYRVVGPYPWEWLIQPVLDLPSWLPPLGAAGLMVIAHGIIQRRSW